MIEENREEPGPGASGSAEERHSFAVAATLTPDQRAATAPAEAAARAGALGLLDTALGDPPLAFPSLGGADERRVEDLIAGRLFPQLRAPLKIGRYTLLDRLGQGGMGVVYAAYDPDLDRRVAIKLLRTEMTGTAAAARLRREAQAMAQVVHANVIAVIEVGEHAGQTYVVMEYLRGIALNQWQETPRSWREVVEVYLQAGRGLAAAHRGGVIHRDFKPHNVMLIDAGVDVGRVKVLDFGLARGGADSAIAEPISDPIADPIAEPIPDEATSGEASARALDSRLTATGALLGTPAYMSPEQLAGRALDARSDQYSFAVALYEALYGQLPYPTGSLAALARAILGGRIAPPPRGREVPAWVHRIVLRGLARDPAERFASMTALCDALARDPGARRRSAALALTLSAVVGLGGWGLAGLTRDHPCEGPAFTLTEVWDEARAEAAEVAFAATGRPQAAANFSRVRAHLDDYGAAWTTLRRESCAAQQRGEHSPELYDLRMACLDRARSGLGALSELLVRADAELVDHAIDAALTLPGLDRCGSAEALLRDELEPEDPGLAEAVRGHRRSLAAIATVAAAGRLDRAAEEAQAILEGAETLGFRPLTAAAALELGTIELAQKRGDAAERALSLALHQGLPAGAARIAAEALVRRIFVRGALLGEAERALGDREVATLFAERFAGDGHLRWLLHNNLGVVQAIRGEYAEAEGLLRTAAAIAEGPTPIERAWNHANLGLVAFERHDLVGALAHYDRALAITRRDLGEAHPLARDYLTHRANAFLSLHRHREARADIDALLQHLARTQAPASLGAWPRITLALLANHRRDHRVARDLAAEALALADPSDRLTIANAEAARARALVGLGELGEAAAARGRALAQVESSLGAEHAVTATILIDAAATAGPALAAEGTVADLRRVLAIRRKAHGEADPYTAASERALAQALLAAGEVDEARELAERARASYDALPGDHAVDQGLAALVVGQVLLASEPSSAEEAAAEALPLLRRALALLEPRLDADDPDLAAARLAFATCLFVQDPKNRSVRKESQRYAASAAETYRSLGPAFAAELKAAEALALDE